jgi:leucine dehydrogenase
MTVAGHPDFDEHENVLFCHDPSAGLRAIIAVHRVGARHALGGIRIHPYPSEAHALTDVLRLSEAMTRKSAMAGLPFGGGKAVVIADPRRDKTHRLMQALAAQIDRLGGLFVAGEDVGTGVADLEVMRERTRHVVGRAGAETWQPTAYGVYQGIRAAVRHRLKAESLAGISIAVQGAGQVGSQLCRHLRHDGAEVYVADLRDDAARSVAVETGATVVPAREIEAFPAQVLAPCALGGTLTHDLARRLHVAVIAGCANNQLADAKVGASLAQRGILYAPDYVINAGGVINNAALLRGDYDPGKVMADTARIYDTLLEVFAYAERHQTTPSEAADDLARNRVARQA